MVLGVAAAHFLAHLDITAGPESGEIPGELDGTARRTEKLHEEGNPAMGDARGLASPQHLLQGHGEDGDGAGQVIDGSAGAGGGEEAGRGF